MLADGALAVHPSGMTIPLPAPRRKDGPTFSLRLSDPGHRRRLRRQGLYSGCVKITVGAMTSTTTAVALRHQLPLITIFTLDAKINDNGLEAAYRGLTGNAARKAVLRDLETQVSPLSRRRCR
jgi:valyl-tRNA synthetase